MAKPQALLVRAPGTNCDIETQFAFERAGASCLTVHVNRLLETPDLLRQSQILCIPGGFSYGDDVAAGKILASRLRARLSEPLAEMRDRGGLILGICNGFQALLKTGLLDSDPQPGQLPMANQATLTWNDHGRYEARWVQLRVASTTCVFLEGVAEIELPVAHAEGKFVAQSESVLAQLESAGQLCLRYTAGEAVGARGIASGRQTAVAGGGTDVMAETKLAFPANPNGSELDVAGMCDPTGRILGMMPHPERFLERHQHPSWTRHSSGDDSGVLTGQVVFDNAVRYFE